MAHVWLALPAALCFTVQDAQRTQFDEGRLVIEWKTQSLYPQENRVVYSGDVKATYGVTVLRCDTLTLNVAPNVTNGVAEGNVHIDDPEGTVEATRLQFNWRERTGEADNAVVRVDPMVMQAQKLVVVPDRYELTNVKITECGVRTPLITMWAPSVTIRPGKDTVARRVTISILNQKIATLRRQELGSGSQNKGIRLPSISIRRGSGLGVTWQAGVPLTNSTYTDFRFLSFPNRRPSTSLTISRSLLNPERAQALLTPRSDLTELFNYGYLENINVEKPEDERNYLSRERLTVSFGSVVNAGAPGRTGRDSLSKPWDVTFEQGGASGGFAMLNQVRLQQIQLLGESSQNRAVAISSILSPPFRLAEKLEFAVRGDGRWYFNEHSQAKWGRLSAELTCRPSNHIRIGAGYSVGSNDGEFAFDFDRLPRSRSYHLRTDLLFGPSRIYMLGKYDPERKNWWDVEFAVYQLAGCFEPYYIYRKSPGTSSFGIRFKVFEAFDRLRENIPRRTKGNVPLSPPDPKKGGGHGMEPDEWR